MISFLSGKVHTKLTDSIILLAGQVGYSVAIPPRLHGSLAQNESVDLYTYTHVREDALDLYGFKTLEELSMFKMVLNVSGIGPKTAMLVVDRGVSSVKQAIQNADTAFFSLIPRLGTKNAQKIIIELKNKLGGLTELNLSQNSGTSELIEALEAIGYTRQEAFKASQTITDPTSPLSVQLNLVLRQMDRK